MPNLVPELKEKNRQNELDLEQMQQIKIQEGFSLDKEEDDLQSENRIEFDD
tara:strand:+ start:370 stop:522 length:153 start_codon:yes stop_codon:yes gene_type:complete